MAAERGFGGAQGAEAAGNASRRDPPWYGFSEHRKLMMDGKAAAPFLYGQGGFVSEGVSGFCSPVVGGDGLDSRGGRELLYVGGGMDSKGGGE
ncbi:hypothetical protein DCAR_0101096 [Daucus carota subsp. sativus]|uniref:Uncharacterized protein n=1 Tax=Daucus carota subsp. sativus TaxID=79200 RepID=A0A166G504_DAUCS|nr:hypothetical protein DCAR_0101096 [Daucus carota subsp. sativus]